MPRLTLSLVTVGVLVLAGCQGMDSTTGKRAGGGAAMGAASGAVVGLFTGDVVESAAIGAAAGAAGGVVYDQYQKGQGQ